MGMRLISAQEMFLTKCDGLDMKSEFKVLQPFAWEQHTYVKSEAKEIDVNGIRREHYRQPKRIENYLQIIIWNECG